MNKWHEVTFDVGFQLEKNVVIRYLCHLAGDSAMESERTSRKSAVW